MTRVLLIDDDDSLRRAWKRTADASPDSIHLDGAASEEEARAALAAGSYDLVVCDWNLGPDGTSEALVRELAAQGAAVVVVTGEAKSPRATLGRDVAVVAKPIGLLALLASWRAGDLG